MAKNPLQRNIKGFNNRLKYTTSKPRLQNTLDSYKTRLASQGYDVEKLTDKRNWLEKALNLEQDQNALFDIFEILGRPQQALFGGIKAAQEGKDVLKGAKEGLTGEKDTQFKEILTEAGMSDRKGKLDVSDVLGFAGDVLLDPMDIPLFGMGKVAKAVKAGDKLKDAIKLADSGSSLLFKGAGKAIKGTAKVGDKAVTAGLKVLDAGDVKRATKLAQETGMTVDDVLKSAGKTATGRSDFYKALKNDASNLLDSSKGAGGLVGRSRDYDRKVEYAKNQMMDIQKGLDTRIRDYATKIANNTGEDVDQVYKNVKTYIENARKADYVSSTKGTSVLNNLKQGLKIEGNPEDIQEIRKIFDKEGFRNFIKYQADETGQVLKIKNVKNINQYKNIPEIQEAFSKINLRKVGARSDEAQEIYDAAKAFVKSDDEIASIFSDFNKYYDEDVNRINKEVFGLESPIVKNANYTPDVVGPEYAKVRGTRNQIMQSGGEGQGIVGKKVYGAKKGDTVQANLDWNQQELSKANKELNRLEKQKYNNKIDSLNNAIANKVVKKGELLSNNKTITDLEKKVNISKEKIATFEKALVDYQEAYNNKLFSKIDSIKDATQKTAVRKAVSKHVDNLTEYNRIKNKILKTTDAEELASLKKQLQKVEKSLEKTKSGYDKAMVSLKGVVDKKELSMIKDTTRFSKNVSKTSVKKALQEQKLSSLNEAIVQNKQKIADEVSKLDEQISFLENSKKGIVDNDAKIMERQQALEKWKNTLESNEGMQKYTIDAMTGIDTFINSNAQYMKGTALYNDIMANGMFSDPDFVKFADDLVDGQLPANMKWVKGDSIVKDLNAIKNFFPQDSEVFKWIEKFKGQNIAMDKNMARMLNLTKNTKEVSSLVKVLDGVNNTFKRFKTFTLGTQMRNAIGSPINMYLSGVPAHKIPVYEAKAATLLNDAKNLTKKVSQGLELTAKEADDWKYLSEFYKAGFTDKGFEAAQDLEKVRESIQQGGNIVKKGLDKATDISLKMNNAVDTNNRLALFMYATDNPGYLKKLDLADAAEAVRYTMFDPSNLSDLEKNGLKRLIPFYTFTKQNLYFQASNIMKNTPKYSRLIKSINGIYNQLDDDSYYKYQKENMQIPLPWTDSNGNQLFLKSNLPLSDLGEYLSNPVGRAVSSLTPAIKTPIEMVMGKDVFTGQDISDESKVKRILGGLGLDNLTYGMKNKAESIIKRYNGDINNNEMWAELFRSVLQNTNQEKVQNSKLYEEMESYQNIINELESQGIDIPTIREINASNKIKLNRVGKKRSNNRRFN